MSQIQVPKGWELKKLSELALDGSDKFTDGPFGSRLKVSDYTDSGYPIIRLQNIGEGKFFDKNWKFTSEEKFQELIRHSTKPGDIIIAKMAEPVARAALVPMVYDDYLIAADCVKLRVNEKEALPRFVLYAINSPMVRQVAIEKSRGVTRLRINLGEIKKLEIPIPKSKETQKKIVQKLDYILGQLEEKRKEIAILDREKSKMLSLIDDKLLLMFVTKTIEQNISSHTELKLLKNLVDDFEKRDPRKTPNHKFKYIEIGGIDSRNKKIIDYKLITGKDAPSRARNVIRTNDVIYGTTRPYYRNIALISSEFDNEICSTGFCVLRAKKDLRILPKFLFYYLISDTANNQILKPIRGVAYPAVSNNDVLNVTVPIFDVTEQNSIISTIDNAMVGIKRSQEMIQSIQNRQKNIFDHIDNTLKSILNSAFSGKLVS